jgi:bifunctional DNase/RNase
VVIQDFRDGTFVANIVVSDGEKNYSIDSRPSDAIALALRFNAPIFATEQVMNDTSVVVGINEEEDDEDEQEEDPKKGLLSMLIPSTTTGTGDNAQSDFQRMLKASTKERLQEL